jgi:hypothetical protein
VRLAALLLLPLALLACSKGKKSGGGGGGGADEYIRKSKTSEAKINLKRLMMSVKTAWAENNTLPASIPMSPALGACCQAPDHKCPPEGPAFAAAGWDKLDFSLDDPHYYSYEVVSAPDLVTLRAKGDLDCNGTYSTFEIKMPVAAGELSAGELSIDNELE